MLIKKQSVNSEKINPEKQLHLEEELSRIALVDVVPRDTQETLRGNKKRFLENLNYNISLIAEQLPGANLICEEFVVGTIAKKRVAVIYLKDRANPGIVSEITKRINRIKAETIPDSSYLERNIENSGLSPFPQVETTTRPDMAEIALFQGRVVVHILIATLMQPETSCKKD